MKIISKLSLHKSPKGLERDALRDSARVERRRDINLSNEAVRDQAERLRELSVLSLFLHSAGTLEEMLGLFLERSPRVTGAIVTIPLLLDRRRELLSAECLSTIEDQGLEQACLAAEKDLSEMELALSPRSWRRDVLESGEVAVTDDLRSVFEDELSREECDQLRHRLGISKVAVAPLVMEGEAFGLCVFLFSENTPDIEILELASGHCTLALKDLMAGEETTRFGGIDPVTWAHSRGYFLEALEEEVVRARRYNRDLSLVFFDIDDFSQFNAEFGHSIGDRLLRSVAMALVGSVALPEVVARYGGDEFAVLLPESNRAAAALLTSHIVDKLRSMAIFGEESREPFSVSASAAIVSFPDDGSNREELLTAGEISLDQSKREKHQLAAPPRQLTPVQRLRISGKRHEA